MVFRDDVVDLEGEAVAFLRHLTVLAPIAGPPPYQFLQRADFRVVVRLGNIGYNILLPGRRYVTVQKD